MRVILTSYTPNPTLVVARAAALCYAKDGSYESINEKYSSLDKQEKLIKNIIDSGHGSCLEHAVFNFHVEGLSRACTHQLVRHRIASYEQRSQRYINEEGFSYVTPPSIENSKNKIVYQMVMHTINECYKELVKAGIPKEDARYMLPNGCESSIVITMNVRSLRNFWELRMCNRAQWEIQELAEKMFDLVKKEFPVFTYKAGPKCVTSTCTEKHRTERCPYNIDDVTGGIAEGKVESYKYEWSNWNKDMSIPDHWPTSEHVSRSTSVLSSDGTVIGTVLPKTLGTSNLTINKQSNPWYDNHGKQVSFKAINIGYDSVKPYGGDIASGMVDDVENDEKEREEHYKLWDSILKPTEYNITHNTYPTEYGHIEMVSKNEDDLKKCSLLEHINVTYDHNTHYPDTEEDNFKSKE